MISSKKIIEIATSLGVDACGIANIDRFTNTPAGFNPKDVYSKCESVIVFLKTMPSEVIMAENPVPYTHTAYLLYSELDRIGLDLCRELATHEITSVPVPTDTRIRSIRWPRGIRRTSWKRACATTRRTRRRTWTTMGLSWSTSRGISCGTRGKMEDGRRKDRKRLTGRAPGFRRFGKL